MAILKPFIYQDEKANPRIGPFKLQSGQYRDSRGKVLFQQPWFNGRGEFLGFGDLSLDDIKYIAEHIPHREFFVGCFLLPGLDGLKQGILTPSINFIAKRCQFIIAHKMVIYVEGSCIEEMKIQFSKEIKWCSVRPIDAYHWLLIEEDDDSSNDSNAALQAVPKTVEDVFSGKFVRFVVEETRSGKVDVKLTAS